MTIGSSRLRAKQLMAGVQPSQSLLDASTAAAACSVMLKEALTTLKEGGLPTKAQQKRLAGALAQSAELCKVRLFPLDSSIDQRGSGSARLAAPTRIYTLR